MGNHIPNRHFIFGLVVFKLENYFQLTQNSGEPEKISHVLKRIKRKLESLIKIYEKKQKFSSKGSKA
jgi:hypothetical protein